MNRRSARGRPCPTPGTTGRAALCLPPAIRSTHEPGTCSIPTRSFQHPTGRPYRPAGDAVLVERDEPDQAMRPQRGPPPRSWSRRPAGRRARHGVGVRQQVGAGYDDDQRLQPVPRHSAGILGGCPSTPPSTCGRYRSVPRCRHPIPHLDTGRKATRRAACPGRSTPSVGNRPEVAVHSAAFRLLDAVVRAASSTRCRKQRLRAPRSRPVTPSS